LTILVIAIGVHRYTRSTNREVNIAATIPQANGGSVFGAGSRVDWVLPVLRRVGRGVPGKVTCNETTRRATK
jgi:hypothetical protein